MLNISFEIPDNLDLAKLNEQAQELNVTLEEVPGTYPRLLTATALYAEAFYRLGGIVALEILVQQNI
ncbi:hypothetical protein I5907_11995 [Panacibacter sp. DH6]|uniref:Uncharacterized protein n=1 Tax=Panacibacter microcysteis TaxID=2793269 RepID=A0A931E8B4_9BACT|nr:hypothetical protein [Panacibacter microcysteis]MBG9376958.1 hypothetical protein [Panacibacter microcysteis]